VTVASEAKSPANDPHWWGLRRPTNRATHESLEFMILSRISGNVWRRTITPKEEGGLYEGFPGLSGTMPSAFLRVGGCKPWATSGA